MSGLAAYREPAFRNNLDKGNRVVHADTKRPGVVTMQPRESSRYVQVTFQGNGSPTRVDVMLLRLVYENLGKTQIEEVPPIDGTPPADERVREARPTTSIATFKSGSPADMLRLQRADLRQKLHDLQSQGAEITETIERIGRAIDALEPPPSVAVR